ncbi:hypothetical protein [Paenarthrobacter nitroguajacolicus]|uniref:hypothetical protein n=1 Tax=Paenarthrobacter nitroguajacolicus TaxID=211146 RepID=UPI00405392A7
MRLFPDYGDTALWLENPIDYSLTGLPESLVKELQSWEQSYYASLTQDLAWKSADLASRYTSEGNRLAQLVADELGDGYEVEFRSYEENARPHRFCGTKAPNQRAVAAFDALVAGVRAEKVRISRAVANDIPGAGTGWFASSPLSGKIFRPTRAELE